MDQNPETGVPKHIAGQADGEDSLTAFACSTHIDSNLLEECDGRVGGQPGRKSGQLRASGDASFSETGHNQPAADRK